MLLPRVSFHGVEANFVRHEATLVAANRVSFAADAIPFVMKEVLLNEKESGRSNYGLL